MDKSSGYFKNMQKKIVTKLVILFVLLAAFVVTGNTTTIRPVKSNKKTEAKKESSAVEATKEIKQTEYLKYILPGVLAVDPADKKVTYKKDANGNYTMVMDEGC